MTKTIDALVEALEPVATWMEQSANCSSGGPDHPPEPTSQFDYELLQAASEIRAALAQARAEQAEPAAFVSPLQFEQRLVDPEGEFGTYIPMRKTSAGNFTQPLFATPPAAPVAKLEPWMVHARKLVQWRHCMSYNDSYFGEPAGLLKQITAELDHLLPEERLEAAHNAKLGNK